MVTTGFHFEQPYWLLALCLPFLLWRLPKAELQEAYRDRVKHFADSHLLPHLILQNETISEKQRRSFYLWGFIWSMAVFAMAGPRWDYTDIFVAKPTTDVIILLDMSRSMAAKDVRPSRFARAKQEIEDFLREQQNLRIGLIGFASVAHVVTPVTDDIETLLHFLPALSTGLVQWQFSGSRLSQALDVGRRLLFSQPKLNRKVLLLISDGDFAEPIRLAQQIEAQNKEGIQFFVLGIGDVKGTGLLDHTGKVIRDHQGQQVSSGLAETQLKKLAAYGQGIYVRADYRAEDTRVLLKAISDNAVKQSNDTVRLWDNRFYLPVMMMMLLILSRFLRDRKGRLL